MSYTSVTDNRPNTSELDINMLVNQWHEGVKKRDINKLLLLLHPDMQLTVPFQTEAILGHMNALQTFKAFDEYVNNFNYKMKKGTQLFSYVSV